MVITLEDIFPMDKGNSTYTEYTFDESIVKHMMKNDHLDDCKMGHIHSHNTMSVFFSGTDMSELEDNAPNHNMYLSLIVNNFMDFCAKLCFVAEVDEEDVSVTYKAKDEKGEVYELYKAPVKLDSSKLIIFDCDIETPLNGVSVDDDFKRRTEEIIEISEKKHTYTSKHTKTVGFTPSGGLSNQFSKVGSSSFAKAWEDEKGKKTWGGNFNDLEEWGDTFSTEEPVSKGVTTKTFLNSSARHFDGIIDDFTLFLLNGANTPSRTEIFLEDILDNTLNADKTPFQLCKDVLDIYGNAYDKFFDNYINKDTDELFIDVLAGVIFNLEHELETATTDTAGLIGKLQPLVEALNKMEQHYKDEAKV